MTFEMFANCFSWSEHINFGENHRRFSLMAALKPIESVYQGWKDIRPPSVPYFERGIGRVFWIFVQTLQIRRMSIYQSFISSEEDPFVIFRFDIRCGEDLELLLWCWCNIDMIFAIFYDSWGFIRAKTFIDFHRKSEVAVLCGRKPVEMMNSMRNLSPGFADDETRGKISKNESKIVQ